MSALMQRLAAYGSQLKHRLKQFEETVASRNPRVIVLALAVAGVASHQLGPQWNSALLLTALLTLAYLVMLGSRLQAVNLKKEMHAALSRSESQSRLVIDTAPDAFIGVDAQGLICQCNSATSSIFGYPSEDLLGQALNIILPALPPAALAPWFAEHGISGRVVGHATEGRRVDGTVFPIAVSASDSVIDGQHLRTFIVRDDTDARWADQELHLRERALSSSADGIVISDMRLPNCPVIYANHAFEAITGYGVSEILGQNCNILQGPDSDPQMILRLRQAIEDHRPCLVVIRNYRKDGRPFWNQISIAPVMQPDGQVSHYVGALKDVSDRIASEQDLQQRTERLNAVFDLSPDGFVVLDGSGQVSIVNPVFERMTGLQAAELVGQSRETLEARLDALCNTHEVVVGLPMAGGDEPDPSAPASAAPRSAGAGHELLHLHSPVPRTLMRRIRHGSGDTQETVMYLRDITHELEVDRMKSEFLSMAAHELRTPMASIFGFTELLLKRNYDDGMRRDMLSTIHKQAAILIGLVNELLDLARIEARRGKDFQRQPHQLQIIVRDAVAALLTGSEQRGVTLQLPAEPVWLDVDAKKLSQALSNVLSNAYKYSPGGGDITLGLEHREHSGHQQCGICVRDHGIGMSPEHLQRVFERFFRADTSGNIPGTGLGMTIVKEIIELHGGQVQVESVLGQGTTVTLWLPVLHESNASGGQPAVDANTLHALP